MSGVAARRLAIEALVRIDSEGAFANIVLPKMLERSDLEARDRGFVTELVYGTTRMQRTCDFLVDRFLMSDVEPLVRSALRIGAYQLVVLQTPAHAAVGETVGAVPKRVRGIVNAVLRKVQDERRLLQYRGLEGLEHQEVGALLGLSSDAAAKRWQRLRDRLRDLPDVLEFLAA